LYAELEGCEEGVGDCGVLAAYMIEINERTLVAGEDDMRVLEEMCTEEIAKRMVFLIKREDGAVWSTCTSQ